MERLSNYLNDFPKAHVLCVGDLMLDRYVYGSVSRISPEAPIPILNVEREFYTLGGVGNVAANIKALGATPHMVGGVGMDLNGHTLNALCIEKHINIDHLIQIPHFQTILKNRYCSHQQQLLRVDYEKIHFFDEKTYAIILSSIEKLIKQTSVLILSDYGKGFFHPKHLLAPLLKIAQQYKVQTIVDPKSKNFAIYQGATIITPNRKELHEATHLPTHTTEQVEKAAYRIIQDHDIRNVLATRSEEGLTLVRDGLPTAHFPAKAKEVFDVSGAGDTVIATLAVSIAAGAPLEKAANIANIAGSIVVGKIGTATVTSKEILEANNTTTDLEADKVHSLPHAIDLTRKWRKKGLKIGFTNGCFDLLHKGHITLLKQSKSICDRLVVGLNSDSSVKRLKGESRPIKSQEERAIILAALQYVDMVVIFDEDTPLRIIEALEPDVLIKGADYTEDKVVGAPFVKARGGRVVLINLVDGFSTTNTVKKLQEEL